MISELGRLLARVLGDDIELALDLAPATPGSSAATAAQLEQVVVNLAVNARDAMPGGGRLAISTAASRCPTRSARSSARARSRAGRAAHRERHGRRDGRGDPGDDVRSVLHDQGRGRRARPVDRPRDRQAAGGAIAVDSRLGLGTTIRIYLPAVAAPPAAPVAPPVTAPAPGETAARAAILLVEDRESLRRAIAQALRELGHDVVAVEDAEAGQAAARTRRFDLLIADLMLPRGSGADLAAALCAAQPALKVLFISGRASPPQLAGIPASSVGFLAKPFTIEMLEAGLAKLLAH